MFSVEDVSSEDVSILLSRQESQFFDFKRKDNFDKISKTISAFANADGGELLVGVGDPATSDCRWLGYDSIEDANGHVAQLFAQFDNGAEYLNIDFIHSGIYSGYVMRVVVQKTPYIVRAVDGKVYRRQNAQDRSVYGGDLHQLELDKGVRSYEDQVTDVNVDELYGSEIYEYFKTSIVPHSVMDVFFKRERIVSESRVRVSGVLLFSDLPQAILAQSAIKVYRYKSLSEEGTRNELAFDPITIEGPIYNIIRDSVATTKKIIEDIPILKESGFRAIKYPEEAIHEVICNAVIHRDYSINDYVHVRIFDNRVEVESPGKLAGPVTVKNILNQRFARNKKIVRLINKFPSPPNKDVGEGLNTAARAMQDLNLGRPEIRETDASVVVVLKHEPLASKEELIINYLKKDAFINNSIARRVCSVQSDSVIRKIFKKMMESGLIEKVPGTAARGTKYRAKH